MHEKVRFYVHQTAREAHKIRAIELSWELSRRHGPDYSRWQPLRYPLQPVPDEVETAIVVGGDGSVLSIARLMAERENPGVVLTAGGGSEDGFRRSLIRAKSTIAPDEIVKAGQLVEPLNLARVNEHTFLYIAELGRAAEPFNQTNEGFRGSIIPRDARMVIAALATGLEQSGRDKPGPILRGFFTTPDYKSSMLFPDQKLHSDEITMITIPSLTKTEMIVFSKEILLGLRNNRRFPAELLSAHRASEIVIPDPSSEHTTISLGGDVYQLEPHNSLIFSRKDTKPLQVAALYKPLRRRTKRL